MAEWFDIAVVGAGPAGIASACRAAETGARTVVLDEGFNPGGQIYRHRRRDALPPLAREWLDRFDQSGAVLRNRTAVHDAERASEGWTLAGQSPEGRVDVNARHVVLAQGARELFLPFPGWTLPNVVGAGAAQALVKQGLKVEGKTVVVAGSGPLLLPVAATLAREGAHIAVVAEQARLSSILPFAARIGLSPGKLREAISYRLAFHPTPYVFGRWVVSAAGPDRVRAAVLTDGRRVERIACDLLCVSYGLTPNVDLASLFGCDLTLHGVAVDARQRTSIEGVYCAGEPCGIAGVDTAIVEGQIAGLAAAGVQNIEDALVRQRARGRRYAAALNRAFQLRPELGRLARPDTIVCRCEDVAFGALDPDWVRREAKLYTRAGMGACQGRICGPALSSLFGWERDSVRPPMCPVTLENLLSPEDE